MDVNAMFKKESTKFVHLTDASNEDGIVMHIDRWYRKNFRSSLSQVFEETIQGKPALITKSKYKKLFLSKEKELQKNKVYKKIADRGNKVKEDLVYDECDKIYYKERYLIHIWDENKSEKLNLDNCCRLIFAYIAEHLRQGYNVSLIFD